MARKSGYKKEYCEELIEHMAEGYSYESFAGKIRVAKQTIYNWEKNEEFLDAKKVGRAAQQYKMEQICLKGLWKTRDGEQLNNGIIIWFMKNTCGWKDNPEIHNSPPEEVMEDTD